MAQEKEIKELSLIMAEKIVKEDIKTIAVVDFTDLQGNVTKLGRFLAEEFSVVLASVSKDFKVIERINLKSIVQEYKLSVTGIIDPKTATKLGEIKGVEALITGVITPFKDSVRFSVKALKTDDGEIICALAGNIPKTKTIEEIEGEEIKTPSPEPTPIPPTETGGKLPGIPTKSFFVYPSYTPSGYMGDICDIIVEERPEDIVRFIYKIRGRGPHEWEWKYVNCKPNPRPCQFAGVMYLNPPSNWGEWPDGGFDLRGFQCVKWEARSVTGTVNVEFIIGGVVWRWDDQKECLVRVPVPYPDSMSRTSLGIKTLTEDWQSFEYDLSDRPEEYLKRIVGGFAWVISWGSNQVRLNEAGTGPEQPQTFEIEIRNIRYERGDK